MHRVHLHGHRGRDPVIDGDMSDVRLMSSG